MVKIGHIELGEFSLLLAPMEDITDPAFRKVIKPYGADLYVHRIHIIRRIDKECY